MHLIKLMFWLKLMFFNMMIYNLIYCTKHDCPQNVELKKKKRVKFLFWKILFKNNLKLKIRKVCIKIERIEW